jgi:uncharacterized membrane protein YczE
MRPTIWIMALAIALMSHRSLGFALYSAMLDGVSVEELAANYHLSVHEIRERVEATILAVTRQVRLGINPHASIFEEGLAPAIAA